MKIATWNINSIRLRIDEVIKFITTNRIDILCLQETKTIDEKFPLEVFKKNGYKYAYIRGEKSYNGVAILSKLPIKEKSFQKWCGLEDTRHICIKLENNLILHNFYIPAGGDIPDIDTNSKFKYKIDFIKEVINFFKKDKSNLKMMLGDLNIAPGKNDVWSHKQLINVVSHTKIETKYFTDLLLKGSLHDIIRLKKGEDEKIYSWWSYRNQNWKKSNRGRRLDHILISSDLISLVKNVDIHKYMRDIQKPSDHVPISVTIDM